MRFKKVFSGLLVVAAVLITSHFRAYMYSDKELQKRVGDALYLKHAKYTQCDEFRFLNKHESNSFNEVVAYTWVCLNQASNDFYVTATVESDGYVNVERIALTRTEINEIIKAQNGEALNKKAKGLAY